MSCAGALIMTETAGVGHCRDLNVLTGALSAEPGLIIGHPRGLAVSAARRDESLRPTPPSS